MRTVLTIGAVATACFSLPASAEAFRQELCPGLIIQAGRDPNFSDSEKVLLCGTSKTKAWKQIPNSQVIFSLRNFLQDRGYFSPRIDERNGALEVTLGSVTRVETITVEPLPAGLELGRIRRIGGEILTPDLLGKFEERLLFELQTRSIACPRIKLNAFPERGAIEGRLSDILPQSIQSVSVEPIDGMDANILTRYHAFKPGDAFQIENLRLSTQRILSRAIVLHTDFKIDCHEDGVHITQRTVPGPPRQVTFGIGANTELGAAVNVSWSNTRLGLKASTIEAGALLYFRDTQRNRQEATLSGTWYYLPGFQRHFLHPSLSIKHDSQAGFEWISAEASLRAAFTWDTESYGGRFSVGPALTGVNTVRGQGRRLTEALSANMDFSITSHDYELYQSVPRSGYDLRLSSAFAQKGIFSDITFQSLSAEWKSLWNLGGYLPPLFVVGVRARVATTIVSRQEGGLSQLPSTFRHFVGGSGSLRGFNYLELPNRNGGLTAAFLSLEFRAADLLPFGLQPFLFTDFGKTGNEPLAFDSPLAWSPGFGLRWQSPIGVIRSTLSHGLLVGSGPPDFEGRSHWQFYLSYGEEF